MMWLIASLIGGFILKARAVVLLPLAYLASKRSRDLALVVYFFYALALMNEIRIRDLLSYDGLAVSILIILPSIMALREFMEGFQPPKADSGLPMLLLLTGIFYKALFFVGVLLMIVQEAKVEQITKIKNLLIAGGLLFGALLSIRLIYSPLYTPGSQVAMITAFTILTALKEVREKKGVEFKLVG